MVWVIDIEIHKIEIYFKKTGKVLFSSKNEDIIYNIIASYIISNHFNLF